MAGSAPDAGVVVDCPSCGSSVLQKAMIPVLGEGGTGVRYLCVACARQFVDTAPKDVPRDEGDAGRDEEGGDEEGAEETA
jgi:DNA-directed RNA polymerase subunit RPC12/RpoP